MPIRAERSGPGGAWAQRRGQRRSVLPTGVDWGDPALVIDLTGPVTAVTLPPVTRPLVPTAPGMVPGRLVSIAAVAIVVLNVLDIITTRLALAGGATEGNPLASLFVHHLPIFVAIEVLLPALVALRMWVMSERTPPMLLAAMWWVAGVYSLVVVINGLHLI